jgi:hypothetical protein
MMTLFFGIIAVIAQFLIYKKSVPVFFVVMLSSVVMIILVLFFVLKSHYPKLLRVTFLRPLLVKISSALPGLIRIHPGKIIIISMAVHAALILQTAVLFGMFGSDSFLKNCIVAAESYTFMLFLPFFIANIGLREYSFSLFLSDLAPSLNFEPHITAAALGASSIVLLINIIMPALIGLLWVVVTQGEKKGTILQKKKEKVPVLR